MSQALRVSSMNHLYNHIMNFGNIEHTLGSNFKAPRVCYDCWSSLRRVGPVPAESLWKVFPLPWLTDWSTLRLLRTLSFTFEQMKKLKLTVLISCKDPLLQKGSKQLIWLAKQKNVMASEHRTSIQMHQSSFPEFQTSGRNHKRSMIFMMLGEAVHLIGKVENLQRTSRSGYFVLKEVFEDVSAHVGSLSEKMLMSGERHSSEHGMIRSCQGYPLVFNLFVLILHIWNLILRLISSWQLFADHDVGVLVTIQDDAVNNRLPHRIAITAPNPCQQAPHLREATGYAHEVATFWLGSGHRHYVEQQAIPIRHGTGFHLVVTHAFLSQGGASSSQAQTPVSEGLQLLQRRACLQNTGSERLTHGAVAQAHGPGTSQIIELDQLIETSTATVAVRLKAGHSDLQVPQFIEIPHPANPANVAAELRHWGHDCEVIQFGEHEQFLCFSKDFTPDGECIHYMFCNQDLQDLQGCILHSQIHEMTQRDMMKFLDSLGYARAVILEEEVLPSALHRVIFCDTVPAFAHKDEPGRIRSTWPLWHKYPSKEGPFFPAELATPDRLVQGEHIIRTGFSQEDIKELINAGKYFLCEDFTAFDGLDFPDFVQTAISLQRTQKCYDRWLIYTDGTSQSRLRRHAPQHADALGFPDAWAMIVLGEKLMPDGSTIVEPLGWHAQPVHYDPSGACFTFADRIGAEVAEREALIWAGIWRLSQDSSTPTIFCCDSLSCGNQAFGIIGVGTPDAAYRLLRGIFQCLEHGLPSGHLALHHIRSHAGDPYNEFVDLTAKREAQNSFNLKQAGINMQKWHKIFPHLWLIFGERSGLPKWQNGVLATEVPQLPSTITQLKSDSHYVPEAAVKCAISFATANVLSLSRGPDGHRGKLSRGPDGHRGKLHYLFDQMQFFRLNVLGLQECRSDEGLTTSHSILRFMSGHQQGQGGVELWINLRQPIAHDSQGRPVYFQAHQFQVIAKDYRRLLVKVVSEVFDGWLFVAHAPHSGRPEEKPGGTRLRKPSPNTLFQMLAFGW